ncbi:CTP synthase N-terminus-domain-containing protein [Thermothelomyces heterothallicus CBS 202.75]|uniref:CTP synthase N-terminus-domain-containing protein n=1 Tax=Thermothelomyces heterothallicus CBS 202.75 TaxID=1149848 RepID=UPI003742B259
MLTWPAFQRLLPVLPSFFAFNTLAVPFGLSRGPRPPAKALRCNRAFFAGRPVGSTGYATFASPSPVAYGGSTSPLCAVAVRVRGSSTSSYRLGLLLPDKWNSRFLVVGNGGFAGGINWLDMIGIVSTPDRCAPDLTVLLCSGKDNGAKDAPTSRKADSSDWTLSANNELLHPGLTFSSEGEWYLILNGSEPVPYGIGYARDFLFDNDDGGGGGGGSGSGGDAPPWDWRTSFNESVVRYADEHDPGDATADDCAALGAVRERGGKVVIYHDFMRLFLVPGVGHCYRTAVDAPWNFGGAFQAGLMGSGVWSVPGLEDAEHDALIALVDWVEKGKPLDGIVATTAQETLLVGRWEGHHRLVHGPACHPALTRVRPQLLKTLGLRVSCIKIDPYVSVDAGLMAPAEHGECFVLCSGGEVDLDLGNYERYLSVRLTSDHNITTGKVYLNVIQKERRGDYLGKTVQIVPHVTDSIKEWIRRVSKIPVDGSNEEPDVCIIELGGTIGDIESMPFIEALTQLRHEAGSGNFMNIHVSYVPTVHGEQKTKPTQHAVKSIRSHGLIPDIVACRCETPLAESTVAKLALHCQVEADQVLVVRDMPTIYQVPLLLREQELIRQLRAKLALDKLTITPEMVAQGEALWDLWTSVVTPTYQEEVKIALVGKYVRCQDAYLSVVKALEHSAMRIRRKLNLMWIDSSDLEPTTGGGAAQAKYHKAWHDVSTAEGIIVPGGFGHRGTEGMMRVTKWARENNIPFLGVCLGFQVAAIQFARDLCGMPEATSEEFDAQAKELVVVNMPELDKQNMGGTMRLGLRKTIFQPGTEWSRARALYGGVEVIEERHRHRYEINPRLVETLEKAGLHFVGKDETGDRMEVFELKDHPFFVGTQFHAEYQSQVVHPSRPYLGFIAASAGCLDKVLNQKPVEPFKTVTVLNGTK